jgi:hypothetical protein
LMLAVTRYCPMFPVPPITSVRLIVDQQWKCRRWEVVC